MSIDYVKLAAKYQCTDCFSGQRLLQLSGQAPQTAPIPENNEPDDDELDDILECFGS